MQQRLIGEIFRGKAFGRQGGPLVTASSNGTVCEGTWERKFPEMGVAQFEYDDGRRGVSIYSYFEETSGTAVGNAEMTNGQVIRFWSGWNLETHFNQVAPWDRKSMACEVKELLLG